jgi:hypothetical protein
LAVRLPVPLAEVWEGLQPEVEQLALLAGLNIIRAVIEDEVMRRVGRVAVPEAALQCVRWASNWVTWCFAGRRLQHDGRRQRAVHEGIVAEVTARSYRWAVESVPDSHRAAGSGTYCLRESDLLQDAEGSWFPEGTPCVDHHRPLRPLTPLDLSDSCASFWSVRSCRPGRVRSSSTVGARPAHLGRSGSYDENHGAVATAARHFEFMRETDKNA